MGVSLKPGGVTNRRQFLAATARAGTGLVLGFYVPNRGPLFRAFAKENKQDVFAPNAFIRIAPDNTVTVISKHAEGGQGIYTALATLVAEELDAAWSQIRIEPAPAIPDLYKNLQFGSQVTGGSNSISNSYEQYRRAGATARALLVAAAARRWRVAQSEIIVAEGVVKHKASSRHATLGQLAQAAAAIAVPDKVTLKNPKDCRRSKRWNCSSHTSRNPATTPNSLPT